MPAQAGGRGGGGCRDGGRCGRLGADADDAYVEVVLTDPEPVLDPVQRLRGVYPNLLSLRREVEEGACAGPSLPGAAIKARSTFDLFAEFFADVKPVPLDERQGAALAAVLTDLERDEREAVGEGAV